METEKPISPDTGERELSKSELVKALIEGGKRRLLKISNALLKMMTKNKKEPEPQEEAESRDPPPFRPG